MPAEIAFHSYTLTVSPTDPSLGIAGASASLTREGANAPTPVGWTFCGNENDSCSVSQPTLLLFGNNPNYSLEGTQVAVANYGCSVSNFGDPYKHVAKSCFTYPYDQASWSRTFCANEGSNCTLTGNKGELIAFGATVNGTYQFVLRYFPAGTQPFSCSIATFGGTDPAHKTAKACTVMVYF